MRTKALSAGWHTSHHTAGRALSPLPFRFWRTLKNLRKTPAEQGVSRELSSPIRAGRGRSCRHLRAESPHANGRRRPCFYLAGRCNEGPSSGQGGKNSLEVQPESRVRHAQSRPPR